VNLYGLVLVGGRSRRMQTEKSLLLFRGQTLLDIALEKLEALCKTHYVSLSEPQAASGRYDAYPGIIDCWPDIGPMGGLLSAFDLHPNSAWLALACDMPLLKIDLLQRLIDSRNPKAMGTFFATGREDSPNSTPQLQPLCGIYEAGARTALQAAVKQQNYSLTSVLEDQCIQTVAAAQSPDFTNLNTPAQYHQISQLNLQPQ